MPLGLTVPLALLVIALPVFGQGESELTSEFSRCMDRSGGANPAMLECISAEAARQDRKLNEVYGRLMSELTPERQKQLRKAQRLWIKYTEANCSFYYDPDGGTAARLSANSCDMSSRASRARELEALLSPY